MVEYLSGNRIQGSSTLSESPPQTSWKKLGSGTISSGSASASTSSFTAKDNMMVLGNINGGNGYAIQFGHSSGAIDTGSNYRERYITDGTTNTDSLRSEIWCYNSSSDDQMFNVSEISNYNGAEKFTFMKTASRDGTSPKLNKAVGKWTQTNQIDKVQVKSFSNVSADSKFVVIGCDNDESDSGTNFWESIGSKTLDSSTNSFSVDLTSTKDFLMFVLTKEKTGGYVNPKLAFNDNTSNYKTRSSDNGGSPTDPSGGGNSNIFLRAGEADGRSFTVGYICNLAGVQHGVITDSTNAGSEGAGTAIDRNQAFGWWQDTSRITKINISHGASGSFATGTKLEVFGGNI